MYELVQSMIDLGKTSFRQQDWFLVCFQFQTYLQQMTSIRTLMRSVGSLRQV